MDQHLLSQITTFLCSLALVSAFGILSFRSIHLGIRAYAAQAIVLGLSALLMGVWNFHLHVIIIALFALAVKGFVIPWFLFKVMEKVKIKNEMDPFINFPISLFGSIGLTLLSYIVMKKTLVGDPFALSGFSLALSFMLMGLLLMVGRKKAIMQVLGLLVVENGLFIAALSTSFKMPMAVELGLVFDLLVAVIVMGLLVFRIQKTFGSINTEHMNRLKG